MRRPITRVLASAASAAVLLAAGGCGVTVGGKAPPPPVPVKDLPRGDLDLVTPEFPDHGVFPAKYTCDGLDISPPLDISGVPAGTKELALVLFDTSDHEFVHWIVFGIPNDVIIIREDELPPDAIQATNSYGFARYNGPCPPPGPPHHYDFELYALSVKLSQSIPPGVSHKRALKAILATAIARTDLAATYQRASG
jgi:Raf kinase inhibitor-like YbhB/YbcL family protein